MKNAPWGLLLFLCTALPLYAQENGEVTGRVLNWRDNQPLALVQVQLQGTMLRAITTDDGKFRITGVPPGTYTLQASTVGYYILRQDFMIAAGETKNLDVVLVASNSTVTNSVDVAAGAFEIDEESGAPGFTLQGEERKNLASVLADDPLRAVQSLPGVTSNNDFSSEFSFRGASFDRIGIFFDGVLLHAPVHTTDGQADNGSLTIFNGDLTQDMTLFQGPRPVRYSDRTAGILAVESREGSREKLHGEVSASASNAGVLLEGPWNSNKRGSWLVSFRKSYLQYILNHIDFGDQAPLAFGFMDGQSRLSYDLSSNHTVSLTYLDGTSDVDRRRFRDELGPNTVMASSFRFTFLSAGSRFIPNDRILLTNQFSWTREHGNTTNHEDTVLTDQAYTEWTWHGDGSVMWNKNSTLGLGGQFRHVRQDDLNHELVYTPALVSIADSARGRSDEGGGYVQQAFSIPSGRLHFTAGIREDHLSVQNQQAANPYASVSFHASRTRVDFSFGQYSQFPELNQLFSSFTHGNLLPQRSTQYEAVIEERVNELTRLQVAFYDRQDRDLLARPLLVPRMLADGTLVAADANAQWMNSERGYSRGFEVFLQRRSANGITGWVSYAFGRTVLTDGVLRTSFFADYDQRHTVNAYISKRIRPTVNVSARVTYGTGMPLPGFYAQVPGGYAISQTRNAVRAPAYERTDLRLNKAYIKQRVKTTLYGELINITNRHNRDFDTPGPYDTTTGRTFPNFYSMFPILPSAGVVFEF
jgi:hypothetical protein